MARTTPKGSRSASEYEGSDEGSPQGAGHRHDRGLDHALEAMERLIEINKALAKAAELMKEVPNIDRQTEELLRQLRVRVRFAASGTPKAGEKQSLNFPTEPPVRWEERANPAQDPPSFIAEHYGAWIAQGLTRAHLRIDRKLYQALALWIHKHGALPFDLPTKRELNDRLLKKAGRIRVPSRNKDVSQLSEEERLRLRLYQAARRRSLKKPLP